MRVFGSLPRRYTFTDVAVLLLVIVSAAAHAQIPATRLDEAAALLRKKELGQALPILDGLRAERSLVPIERFQLGWLYGQARRYDTAIAIFEALPEDVPNPAIHHYAIALSYFNMGQYERTTQVLTQAKQRRFTDARSANLLGVAYAKLGEAQKAYQALRDGVVENAADANGYLNLVTLCVDYGNNVLAEKIATNGIDAFPTDARLRLSRGALRFTAGQTEGARSDFQAAIGLAPRNSDPAFFAALAEYSTAQYADAMRTLHKCIDAGIADGGIHYLLAETLIRSDPDLEAEALSEVDAALRLDRLLVPALLLRAKLELRRGGVSKAVHDLEQARELEPENRSVLYLLGRTYQQTGRTTEAKKLFNQVQQDTTNLVSDLMNKKLRKILVERPE